MGKEPRETRAALVTGGSAGIGRAIALALAAEGYTILISGRRPEGQAADLVDSLNRAAGTDGSFYVRGDIADAACRDRLVAAVRERYGSLSVLVNNAGVSTRDRKDMLELTEADMIGLLQVNLIAPFMLSAALAPLMTGGSGPSYIVNISSVSSYAVSTSRSDYCISKAGVSMMTRLFADRLAAHGTHVFEVRPGIIKTDMTKPVAEKYDRLIAEGLLPISRWGTPEDVARAVTGIVLGYHPYSTGSAVDVDGGFHIRRL